MTDQNDVVEVMARAQTQSLPVPTDENPAVGGVVMGRAQLRRFYAALHAAGWRIVAEDVLVEAHRRILAEDYGAARVLLFAALNASPTQQTQEKE